MLHSTDWCPLGDNAFPTCDELVKYIGNRHDNIPPDVYVFIRDYYGDFGIDPPTKVKFRELVNQVDNFFSVIPMN